MLTDLSQHNEWAMFIDDAARKRLLMGLFEAYYAECDKEIIFDTHRGWLTKLPALVDMFPEAKFICCVRNPAWIMDSFERLVQRNPYELSGIYNYDISGSVYSRVEGLSAPTGMYGYAYNALREAVFGPYRDRLMILRYESLVTRPLAVLFKIYEWLGQTWSAPCPHDPESISSVDDAMREFDRRLGSPGLHDVGSRVNGAVRESSALPLDVWERFKSADFWQYPEQHPPLRRI